MKRLVNSPRVPGRKDANGAYEKDAPVEPFRLHKILFDEQWKFVEDPRPFKTAVCSRRSGKTFSCAAHLIHTALETPEVVCLYITLSRNNAKKLIWPQLQKINKEYRLGADEDNTELSMLFPNGSIIYLSGAKDANEIEKFRGLALKLAYIDECQSFREYIRELIDDIVSPALMDYNGSLCLIGTPGPIPAGYFYECSVKSDVWAKHKWTFFQNPFIAQKSGKTHQELLDRELKRRGVDASDPSIQREFFGNWTLDSDSLWLKYNQDLNHYQTIDTTKKYNYIMGIDLGFDDADAIAILAWSEEDPTTYLVHEKVVEKQGLTELAKQIKDLQSRYDISKMVIDQGGLGKKIAEELRRQHALPVEAADKARKQENAAFLNDALRTGKFKAKSGSRFAQDSYLVEIDRGKSRPDKIVISDKYHSDIIDAVLYAFKESPAYAYQEKEKKPLLGSDEWNKAQEEEMWQREVEIAMAAAEARRRMESMGYGNE